MAKMLLAIGPGGRLQLPLRVFTAFYSMDRYELALTAESHAPAPTRGPSGARLS